MEQNQNPRNELFPNTSEEALNELVSLQREQLGILQQLNATNKTGVLSSNPAVQGGLYGSQGISAATAINTVQSPLFSNSIDRVQLAVDRVSRGTSYGTGERHDRAADMMSGASSGAASAFGGVGKIGSMAAGLLIPGGWGIAASAAIGATVGMTVDEIGLRNTYQDYSFRNSRMSINAFESNNRFGSGGFSPMESISAGNKLRWIAPSLKMSDAQFQEVHMIAAENGLLQSANDINSYIELAKEVGKQAKEIATSLRTTFSEGAQILAQMNKMGITPQSGVSGIISAQTGIASTLYPGVTGSSLAQNNMAATAGIINGTGMNASNMLQLTSSYSLIGGRMFDNLLTAGGSRSSEQDIIYNYMRNIGVENVGGAMASMSAQIMNSDYAMNLAASMYSYSPESGSFVLNKNALGQLYGSKASDLAALSSRSLSASINDPSALQYFMNTYQDRLTNDLGQYDMIRFQQTLVKSIVEQTGGKYDTKTALMNVMGMDAQSATMMASVLDKDIGILSSEQGYSSYTAYRDAEIAEKGTFGQAMKTAFGTAAKGLFVYANPVGQAGLAISDTAKMTSAAVNMWWHGETLPGSAFVSETDFWQRTREGRLEYIEEYNKQADAAKKAYSSMSSQQKTALEKYFGITESSIQRLSKDFADAEMIDYAEESPSGIEALLRDYNVSGGYAPFKNLDWSKIRIGEVADLFSAGIELGDGYTKEERELYSIMRRDEGARSAITTASNEGVLDIVQKLGGIKRDPTKAMDTLLESIKPRSVGRLTEEDLDASLESAELKYDADTGEYKGKRFLNPSDALIANVLNKYGGIETKDGETLGDIYKKGDMDKFKSALLGSILTPEVIEEGEGGIEKSIAQEASSGGGMTIYQIQRDVGTITGLFEKVASKYLDEKEVSGYMKERSEGTFVGIFGTG